MFQRIGRHLCEAAWQGWCPFGDAGFKACEIAGDIGFCHEALEHRFVSVPSELERMFYVDMMCVEQPAL